MVEHTVALEHRWRKIGMPIESVPAIQDESERGYADGYEAGMAAAREAHAQEVGETVQRLDQLSASLSQEVENFKSQMNDELLMLVEQLFVALLGQKLFHSQEIFAQAVEILRAKDADLATKDYAIHLNHVDLTHLQSSLDTNAIERYRLHGDATVKAGTIRTVCGFSATELDLGGEIVRLLADLESHTNDAVE